MSDHLRRAPTADSVARAVLAGDLQLLDPADWQSLQPGEEVVFTARVPEGETEDERRNRGMPVFVHGVVVRSYGAPIDGENGFTYGASVCIAGLSADSLNEFALWSDAATVYVYRQAPEPVPDLTRELPTANGSVVRDSERIAVLHRGYGWQVHRRVAVPPPAPLPALPLPPVELLTPKELRLALRPDWVELTGLASDPEPLEVA